MTIRIGRIIHRDIFEDRTIEDFSEEYNEDFEPSIEIREDFERMDRSVRESMVGLKIIRRDYTRYKVKYELEWDTLGIIAFRNNRFVYPLTHRAVILIEKRNDDIFTFTIGDSNIVSSATTKLSRALLGRARAIEKINISHEKIYNILERDAISKELIWWEGVDEGLDGALRGRIPDQGELVNRFQDESAGPYYAKYKSQYLEGRKVSISQKKGTISSLEVETYDRLIDYFWNIIYPIITE